MESKDKKLDPKELKSFREEIHFEPLEVDFTNMVIRQKPGNPLGWWLGDYPNNYFETEKDGTAVFHGNATVWDDLRVPVTSAKPGNVLPEFGAFLAAGGLKTWLFDGGGRAEEIHFTVQLPHGYKVGTDLTPHVHWTPTDTGVGNVRWSLEYTWIDIDGTFGASTTIHTVDAASTTAWEHLRIDFATIDGSAITGISSMLVCRLFRDSADVLDTYASDAALLEIDFHYEMDTFGSRTILTK